jgi:hypothetical protein
MTIRSRPTTPAYAAGWDRCFGKTPDQGTVVFRASCPAPAWYKPEEWRGHTVTRHPGESDKAFHQRSTRELRAAILRDLKHQT